MTDPLSLAARQADEPCWSQANPPGWTTRPKVVVLAPPDKPRVKAGLQWLLPQIHEHADVIAVDEKFEYDFSGPKEDLVIVLGGDGSILQSARQMGLRQSPVLGINLGNLGFLAALSVDRFCEVWPAVAAGECTVSNHLMLHCSVWQGDQLRGEQIGLNEAAILAGPPYSMLQIDLYVDSILATTYSCDGLIISTPIGSTAHNLSAGGPILHKSLQALVISPISPHTLTMRPVVDAADRVFDLTLRQSHPTISAVVDGRVVCAIGTEDRVRIRRAEPKFQLVNVAGQNDYQTLREKLGWGGSPKGKLDSR